MGSRSDGVTRRGVIAKRGRNCCFCGIRTNGRSPAPAALTIDHRITRRDGGGNEIENLFIACLLCNNGRGDFAYEFYLNLVHLHGRDYAPKVADRLRSRRDKVARASRERIKNNLDMT